MPLRILPKLIRLILLPALLALAIVLPVSGGASLILENIEMRQDSLSFEKAYVILTFNAPPPSFPVYPTLTSPYKIIADLINVSMNPGILAGKKATPPIQKIEGSQKNVGGEPNARLEIFVPQNITYTASISGKHVIIAFDLAGKVQSSVSVFSSKEADTERPSLVALDVKQLKTSCQVEASFTSLPQSASVYMLDSPPRIIMDFYNAYVNKSSEKQVAVSPLKSISVVKKADDPPYVGVVLKLDRIVEFRYQQETNKMVVNISREQSFVVGKKGLIIIGTGAILAGGVVTGVILGGQKEDKPASPQKEDLGAPPDFPNY
jgi:hypothetical protein